MDFNFGKPFTEETEEEILKAMSPSHISGFTLLGGEPFEPQNQKVIVELLRKIKKAYPDKNIWCYTGYLFDRDLLGESRARCEYTDEMLSMIDVLVDGEFIAEKRNLMLNFRGSSNQRIILVQQSLKEEKVVLFRAE